MDVDKHTCNAAIAKCEMKCTIGEQCECKKYCTQYVELYNKIIDGGNYCWMTITPKPVEFEDDDDKLDYWLSEFKQLYKCSNELIVVVEYTKKMIMHFHMMIKIKDKIKWKKGFVQRWYYKANIEPIYSTQPKHSIHYLFKEIDTTEEVLERPAHYTIQTLKQLKNQRAALIDQLLKAADTDSSEYN